MAIRVRVVVLAVGMLLLASCQRQQWTCEERIRTAGRRVEDEPRYTRVHSRPPDGFRIASRPDTTSAPYAIAHDGSM